LIKKTNLERKENAMKTLLLAVRGLGVGAVVMGIFASASVSRADNLINDLSAAPAGEADPSEYLAQDFSTAVSDPVLGVTLDLDFNAVAVAAGVGAVMDVYVYNASAGGPGSSLPHNGLLGTVTPTVAGAHDYAVNIQAGHNFSLTAGQDYAIVLDTALGSGTVAWEYATSANAATANAGNGGTFLSSYSSPDESLWTGNVVDTFQLQVVPEPATNAFLGLGVLALLAIQRMRRKHA
jgi:hypothetical protein